jgi:hypothetical protein
MPAKEVQGSSLKYYPVTFDANGNESESERKTSKEIIEILESKPITDVFIFSHGWMADLGVAHRQYETWLTAMANCKNDIARLKEVRPDYYPLLIGLHWPSLLGGDENLEKFLKPIVDVAVNNPGTDKLSDPTIVKEYESMEKDLKLGVNGDAPGDDRDSYSFNWLLNNLYEIFPQFTQFDNLSERVGATLLSPFRTATFWAMKKRACQIGQSGGFELLQSLQYANSQARFHLIGHSFGCILVSAMLADPEQKRSLLRPVNSLSLLQGALSHWSYCLEIPPDIVGESGRSGYFKSIVSECRVQGPIITSQSEHDSAVCYWYPWGAGVVDQVEYGLSEKLPKYGALGAYGAQGEGLSIKEMSMLSCDQDYDYQIGKIYNLNAGEIIKDFVDEKANGNKLRQMLLWVPGYQKMYEFFEGGAHKDITKPEVAHAIWQAVSST